MPHVISVRLLKCASASIMKPICHVQTTIHLISQTLLVLCGKKFVQEFIQLSKHWKEIRVANGNVVLKRLLPNGVA
jgi:hypothetical protein